MAPKNLVYAPVELTQEEGSAEEQGETTTNGFEEDPDMPSTAEVPPPSETAKLKPRDAYMTKIVWRNVVLMAGLHLTSVYAFLFLTWKCRAYTLLWGQSSEK